MLADKRGLALSTRSIAAVAGFDRTVERYLEYRLDAFDHLKATLAADPDFAMAHCLRGYFGMLMGSFDARGMVEHAIADFELRAEGLTARERLHGRALRAWHAGDLERAVRLWDEILAAAPMDLLALQLQHVTLFWMGKAPALRDRIAAALPFWAEDIAGYGHVLAMLAFGLEENGEFAAAERFGRAAVAHNPDDLWAIHAVAHVMEMQGRLGEGSAWLAPPAGDWGDRNSIRGHLWWHAALFPLECGRYERVLELYDRAVRPGERPCYLDLQNAASLLARLEFRGVAVGRRWQELADAILPRIDDHAILFTDLHRLIALARAGRGEAVRRFMASLDRFGQRQEDYEAALVAPLARPLAEAIIAFYDGRPACTLELLMPLRDALQPLGGSHTQRDLFCQLLMAAALQTGRFEIARDLAAERVAARPHSLHNWQSYAASLTGLDDARAALAAASRAEQALLAHRHDLERA